MASLLQSKTVRISKTAAEEPKHMVEASEESGQPAAAAAASTLRDRYACPLPGLEHVELILDNAAGGGSSSSTRSGSSSANQDVGDSQPHARSCSNTHAHTFLDAAEANWLVPGKVLCGAKPVVSNDGAHCQWQRSSVMVDVLSRAAGVTHFVNLGGDSCGEYSKSKLFARTESGGGPVYLEYTIEEFSTGNKGVVEGAAHAIVEILRGDTAAVIYLHCRAGHGRTGMVAAVLLGCLFPALSVDSTLRLVQEFHDARIDSWDRWSSPETNEQVQHVKRTLHAIRSHEDVDEDNKIGDRDGDDGANDAVAAAAAGHGSATGAISTATEVGGANGGDRKESDATINDLDTFIDAL
jgi:hypothetical protein